MFFPFECKNCRKDKWSIRYDSEQKTHMITCANCGTSEILEEIFGNNRRRKNDSKVTKRKKERNEVAEKNNENKSERTQESIKVLQATQI